MNRTKLLAVDLELTTHLKMAEAWHPLYSKDPALFKKLIRAEAKMEQDMRQYFKGLTQRIEKLVNWYEIYRRQSMSETYAEDVVVTVSGTGWDSEEELLISTLSPTITDAATVGALLAELETKVYVGAGAGNAAMLKAVRTHSLDLVKGLNQTTRNQMRQALLQGLDAGENKEQLVARLTDLVDNPKRAELIAQTETVRAATIGKLSIAQDIGAAFKIWEDGQSGECPICLSVSPKRIPVDEVFSTGDDGPPAHGRCRCGLSLDFATPEEAAALADGSYQPDEGE